MLVRPVDRFGLTVIFLIEASKADFFLPVAKLRLHLIFPDGSFDATGFAFHVTSKPDGVPDVSWDVNLHDVPTS